MSIDNDYCVYVHKKLTDNEVFYVGSGRDRRVGETRGRCQEWTDTVEANGFYFEIIKTELSKESSLKLELMLYEEYSSKVKLVNVFKPSLPLKYDPEYFHQNLKYCTNSPTFLVWKTDGSIRANKRRIDESAGGISSGRASLRIAGKCYTVHRIIWTMHFGEPEVGFVVDHIDGNPLNNCIENLRLITQAENSRNTRKLKNNKSGVVGVSLHKNKHRKSEMWNAHYVDLNGCSNNKYFSIIQHGKEEAFRLACEWRQQMIAELNAQGAGYTERHGT